MKKLFAGLAGLAAVSLLAISANAADLSAFGGYKDYTPAAVWTGFYAGANLGYGWGASSDQLACGAACLGGLDGFGGLTPSGWLGGVQAGYNWQGLGSPFVLGVETDVQASSIQAEGSNAGGDTYHSSLQALGTLRGRAGYALDRSLLYFTGGLAWGKIHKEAATASGDFVSDINTTGYVLGGGFEYKVKRDLSLKVEYQYVNLGKNDPADPVAGTYSANGGTVRDDAFNTVRVGVNYFPFTAREPLK